MTEDRMVDVPGGRLFATADGDGPPIVLVHAGIVDSRAWDPLVPLLTKAGYRAIRYDTRGFGRSETDDVEFSNRADLIAILDAFGVERAALVGNSRGATIAFDTAVEYPDRVAAVVLLGGGIGGYEPEPTPEEAAAFEEMEALEEAGTDPEAMADFQFRLWIDGLAQPEGRVGPPLRDWLRPMVVGTCDASRVYGRPIPLRPPAAERLDAATMPILAIHGALDVSDIEATGRHLAATLPNARFEIVPDVAHLVAVEAPDRVAELVILVAQSGEGHGSVPGSHSEQFLRGLVDAHPTLRPVFERHQNDQGAIRPRLLLSDMARELLIQHAEGHDDVVRPILDDLDRAYGEASPEIANLISIGLLERLPGPTGEGASIRALLGERLLRAMNDGVDRVVACLSLLEEFVSGRLPLETFEPSFLRACKECPLVGEDLGRPLERAFLAVEAYDVSVTPDTETVLDLTYESMMRELRAAWLEIQSLPWRPGAAHAIRPQVEFE